MKREDLKSPIISPSITTGFFQTYISFFVYREQTDPIIHPFCNCFSQSSNRYPLCNLVGFLPLAVEPWIQILPKLTSDLGMIVALSAEWPSRVSVSLQCFWVWPTFRQTRSRRPACVPAGRYSATPPPTGLSWNPARVSVTRHPRLCHALACSVQGTADDTPRAGDKRTLPEEAALCCGSCRTQSGGLLKPVA